MAKEDFRLGSTQCHQRCITYVYWKLVGMLADLISWIGDFMNILFIVRLEVIAMAKRSHEFNENTK